MIKKLGSVSKQSSGMMGMLLAVGAFFLWGLHPLFYANIPEAPPIELLAHRLFWSLPILWVLRFFSEDKTPWKVVVKKKRAIFLSLIAGLLMGVSWTTFTYCLTHNQVLSASLGYFINPLCSIVLGIVFLKERLNRYDLIAIGFAVLSLVYQLIVYGTLPILALLMGGAFALYGLVRKYVCLDIFTALTLEIMWMFPISIAIFVYLLATKQSVWIHADLMTQINYMASAPVTLAPLVLFVAAIKRTSLVVIGLSQYIEPTMHFMLAVFIFGELFTSVELISFGLIWLGLCVYIFPIVRNVSRRSLA